MRQKNYIQIFTFAAFILIILFGSIVAFNFRLKACLTNKTCHMLDEIAVQNVDYFLSRMDRKMQVLETGAKSISNINRQISQEEKSILKAAKEVGEFDRVYIIEKNGYADFEGDGLIDLSKSPYFKKAVTGKSAISEPHVSDFNNETIIVLATPIKDQDAVTAVLCGVYSIDQADEMFFKSSYYGEGHVSIVSSDGEVFLNSEQGNQFGEETNFFSSFDGVTFSNGYTLERIKSEMANEQCGTFITVQDGIKNFGSFTPTGINGWYALTYATDVIIEQETNDLKYLVRLLSGMLFSIFLMVLAYIIIKKRRHDREMEYSNQSYKLLISNIEGGVITSLYDDNAKGDQVLFLSEGFTKMTGYTLEDMKARFEGRYTGAIDERDLLRIGNELEKQVVNGYSYSLQYRIHRNDGNKMWVMENGCIIKNKEGKMEKQSLITDITHIKEHVKRLEKQAQADPLTGLYNKLATEQMIKTALEESRTETHALLMLDVDDFKGINDTLGHFFGDKVLVNVSEKLDSVFRENDIVGRIGGDEFTVFINDVDFDTAQKLARDLIEAFGHILTGEDYSCKISCSVGIAFYPKNGETYEELYKNADQALYVAKRKGKNQSILFDNIE